MPPKGYNGNIRDFFKPFTVPKDRIPVNDTIGDEIVVAPQPKRPTSLTHGNQQRPPSSSPTKRGPGRPRKDSPRSSNASTPKRRSHNISPKKASPVSRAKDGEEDDELAHISPASSQQRSMKAVEIHAPPPPPSPQSKREPRDHSITTSFSSISTLSSMPLSSQSSSKRTVKHGLQAVTNSDSGSADSESTDELADVTSFVPIKKRKLTTPGQDVDRAVAIPSTVKPARRSGRLSDEDRRRTTPKMMPSPPRTVYRHSLANMIKQQQNVAKNEARIQEAEAGFEDAKKKREESIRTMGGLSGGLEAAVADDSDQAERMKLAIARTEALQDEQHYFYFRGVTIQEPNDTFPTESGTLWKRYRDDKIRQHAFLSGFVAQLAHSDSFPNDICEWIIKQLPHEEREEMCQAYVEVLRVRCTNRFFALRNAPVLTDFYALPTVRTRDTDPAQGFPSTPLEANDEVPGLRYALRGFQYACAAQDDDPVYVAAVVSSLIPALIDQRVTTNMALLENVSDTIECILDGYAEKSSFQALCKHMHRAFFGVAHLSPSLHCRAVAAMTVRSERAHQLRRMLALRLVTEESTSRDHISDLSSPRWVDIILSRLKTAPEFAIKETSDYNALISLISVLDIAIDAGFSDFSFRHQSVQSSGPINAFSKANPAAIAETNFNKQVDALTNQLRLMCSRIRDAGTSHLRRTEAKSAIDRLVLRLEFCVRTKRKSKKRVFDSGMEQQRDFLDGFLKPAGGHRAEESGDEQGDFANAIPVTLLSERKIDVGNPSSDESTAARATDGMV